LGDLLVVRAEACRHPVTFLEAVMAGDVVNPLLRVQAAGMLVKVPKYATRYLSRAIDIDAPNSIDEAKEQIKQIIALERCRYIGCDEAREQIERCEQATDHEARLRALEAKELPVVDVKVEGGAPQMPGTEDMIMPPRELAVKQDEDTPKGANPWSPDKEST
jgi:hypothetical protein